MALVMLPCDLPWWPAVVKRMERAAAARNTRDLLDAMQRIHDTCNISLDPEEDVQDPDLFLGLATFLDVDLGSTERGHVFEKTIPRMVERAKALRSTKPPQGLRFSLQQQGDCVEYSYGFASSLVANAFFSTYPKRTSKTHPTLRDFNFTNFFKNLHLAAQKAKLRSIFQYFDFLETEHALEGRLIVSRQVMTSKQWLTIEDWLESSVPLCPLTIRHERRLERVEAETKVLHVCFASAKFGDGVLENGVTQETVHVTTCCIDPENYSSLPLSQFEEDNILREMNKSLLGFRQRRIPSSPTDPVKSELDLETGPGARRLSPIGESFSGTPPEVDTEERDNAVNTVDVQAGKVDPPKEFRPRPNGKSKRTPSPGRAGKATNYSNRSRFIVLGSSGEILPVTRRSIGQMSVYSSCNSQSTDSYHSAKEMIDDEPEEEEQKLSRRYSAQLDTPERRGTFAQRLKDALKRENTATETSSTNSSGESSYAVGISVAGSHVDDQNIKLKRGGSRGFVLRDETVDEEFLKESLEAEQKWLGRFRQNQPVQFHRRDTRASSRYSFSTENSSDFSSELEEVYEQLSKWLDDPIDADENRELDARDRAVVRFAGSLLKRALSESFAGVPVQEGEPQPLIDTDDAHQRHKLALAVRSLSLELTRHKNKRQHSVSEHGATINRDVSSNDPEVARATKNAQRRKLWVITVTSEVFQTLADDETTIRLPLPVGSGTSGSEGKSRKSKGTNHLETTKIPRESSSQSGGLLPIATGNWGCGSRLKGDPQLKLVIQWLAASLSGAPRLIYYTCGHPNLSKLDTVSRVLMDRHWSVGDLAAATLRFALQSIEEKSISRNSLFEELIGMDKPSP
ncbi:uncharacterized protein LOC105695623 isoform X2 [Orussus abietinus]|uniref:uncharacterized protein LOC105695623 isoform X2 n=1 Tax=Orussus abietinus TaxID=222816 RepID=UPI000626E38F|nr:uncharacterized protein LOC105695623 isoform X2 [Orussus abietinus]